LVYGSTKIRGGGFSADTAGLHGWAIAVFIPNLLFSQVPETAAATKRRTKKGRGGAQGATDTGQYTVAGG